MSSGQLQSGITTLELDEQEREELLQLLREALTETRVEVHHTQHPAFRDKVKERAQIYRRLIAKFGVRG